MSQLGVRPVTDRVLEVSDLGRERDLRRPRRRWRRVLVLLGAALVLALLGWLVWWSPVLSVREVRVLGAETVSPEQVREASGVALGTPLARVSSSEVTRRVEELGPVRDVEVRYGWPDVLVVVVHERTPVGIVVEAGQRRLVDADDRAYAPAPAVSGLATVAAQGPARAAAVGVLAGLPTALARQVSQVRAGSPDDVVLVLADGTRVRWGAGTDGERKAEVLTALLSRDPRVVDVSAPELPTTRGDRTTAAG